jgi:hypothetical protein
VGRGRTLGGSTQNLGALAAGEKSPEFKLTVGWTYSRDPNQRFFVRASWQDGTGQNEDNLIELKHVT